MPELDVYQVGLESTLGSFLTTRREHLADTWRSHFGAIRPSAHWRTKLDISSAAGFIRQPSSHQALLTRIMDSAPAADQGDYRRASVLRPWTSGWWFRPTTSSHRAGRAGGAADRARPRSVYRPVPARLAAGAGPGHLTASTGPPVCTI